MFLEHPQKMLLEYPHNMRDEIKEYFSERFSFNPIELRGMLKGVHLNSISTTLSRIEAVALSKELSGLPVVHCGDIYAAKSTGYMGHIDHVTRNAILVKWSSDIYGNKLTHAAGVSEDGTKIQNYSFRALLTLDSPAIGNDAVKYGFIRPYTFKAAKPSGKIDLKEPTGEEPIEETLFYIGDFKNGFHPEEIYNPDEYKEQLQNARSWYKSASQNFSSDPSKSNIERLKESSARLCELHAVYVAITNKNAENYFKAINILYANTKDHLEDLKGVEEKQKERIKELKAKLKIYEQGGES